MINIVSFSQQCEAQLKAALQEVVKDYPDLPERAVKALAVIEPAIDELRRFVYQYRFQNTKEEIAFFKTFKPVCLSQYFYYQRLFELSLNEPLTSAKARQRYYHEALEQLRQYGNANREFYRYCLSGATRYDDTYFTRRDHPFKKPGIDQQFTTGYDDTLARLLANNLLKEHLQAQLQKLEDQTNTPTASLTWTASKTDLIELVYAIHAAETLNKGTADIKQIAKVFETLFNTSLGNYYRVFQDIRMRKKGQTIFLDRVKEALVRKMEEMD